MTHRTRIVAGLLMLALLATLATAQEKPDPIGPRAEIERLRAEADALEKRIDELEAEGRLDEVKASLRRLEILKEHLARFRELERLVDETREDVEKQKSLLRTIRPALREVEARFPGSAWLGISLEDAEEGARVLGTVEKSPARATGLREGDVIVALDDTPIADAASLVEAVRAHEPGETVVLRLERGDETVGLEVKLGARPRARAMPTLPGERFAVVRESAELARQTAAVRAARERLAAVAARARDALRAGRYDEAAKASIEAQAATDALRAAEARLVELRAANATLRLAPGAGVGPSIETRMASLEKRLGSIEGRLARIEKLLEQLAR